MYIAKESSFPDHFAKTTLWRFFNVHLPNEYSAQVRNHRFLFLKWHNYDSKKIKIN